MHCLKDFQKSTHQVWGRAVNRKLLSHSSVHSPLPSAFTTAHLCFPEDYHVGTYYSKLLTSPASFFFNKWRSGSWQKVIIVLGSKDCNCLCHTLYWTFFSLNASLEKHKQEYKEVEIWHLLIIYNTHYIFGTAIFGKVSYFIYRQELLMICMVMHSHLQSL